MNWVNSASDVEVAQMKLIYAVMFVAVGIMPLSEANQLRPHSILSKFDDGTEDHDKIKSVKGVPLQARSATAPLHKRFVSIDLLLPRATKLLKNYPREALQAKWRWLYRDNCDKMVLRYIRQMGSSKKVVTAIAETLASYFDYYDPEELLRHGEAHYVFDKPSARMMQQHEVGKRAIVGHDKWHRPVNVLTARRSFTNAQSRDEMQRYSMYIIELTYMMCQDDVDGAVIVFDMQGFKRVNMDVRIVKFILLQLNKLYPMILNRIIVYRAPVTMRATYKLLFSLLDPNLRDRATFTSNPQQLLAAIDQDQLPPQLGGTSSHKHVWTNPTKEDDAPMRDDKTKAELTAQKDEIIKRLERATKKWIVTSGSETWTIEQERREILKEYYNIYWLLDPYVRSRTVYDRNGIFGLQRAELKEGAIAQPVCKVVRDAKPKPELSRTGSRATFNDNDTLVSYVDGLDLNPERPTSFSAPVSAGSVAPSLRSTKVSSPASLAHKQQKEGPTVQEAVQAAVSATATAN